MSLLSDAMEKCFIINRVKENDGYGGMITRYSEGASFEAAITFNTSLEARVASKSGVTSLYVVTTQRSFVLEYHEIFRRASDGKIFRVTSDGDDKYTPKAATLDMRQVTAEEWVLTDGELVTTNG